MLEYASFKVCCTIQLRAIRCAAKRAVIPIGCGYGAIGQLTPLMFLVGCPLRSWRTRHVHVAAFHEATLRIGTEPLPPLMSTPLFGPPGAIIDTDHAVVIAAAAIIIAMVMILRISSFSP